jgi:hypothetical protein
MGGKTSTGTQSMQIPPEIMARYNSVNKRAEEAASQPFQEYSSDPNAFVAPINTTQQTGINQTLNASQQSQPYFGAATGMTTAGSGAVNPEQLQTAQYMNPFTQNVVDATTNALNQQQGMQLSNQQSQAIKSGAFGGNRSGLERAVLQGQQGLATAQAISPLYQRGYEQALSTAQQQQGVNLGAQQANQARLLQGGQQLAGLGAAAQTSALQGASAVQQAGGLQQQTDQAGKSAIYNQWLQKQGYPFQVAQFLSNIATGTGSLSGNTTTTTQPAPFFGSDRRLKHDVKRIGETDKGLPIYSFKYKDDPEEQTRIGFMADEVEKRHPEDVGLAGGYKTVNYEGVADKESREHRADGGIVPDSAGGAVLPEMSGEGYANGGYADGGYAGAGELVPPMRSIFGGPGTGGNAGLAQVLAAQQGSGQRKMLTPSQGIKPATPQFTQLMQAGKDVGDLGEMAGKGWDTGKSALFGSEGYTNQKTGKEIAPTTGLIGSGGSSDNIGYLKKLFGDAPAMAKGGGVNPYALTEDPMADVVDEGEEKKRELMKPSGGIKAPVSPFSQIMGGVGAATSLAKAGGTAMEGLAALGEFLPMLLLANGGVAGGRKHYDDGGNVPTEDGTGGDAPPEDRTVDKIQNALKRIESSGDYEAIGPSSRKGDKPYGAYQVMGANVGPWTREALGKEMTPEEFLANPKAQDATAKHHIAKYYNQYGTPQDVASMWLSGRPVSKDTGATDVLGTSVPKYVNMFNRYYEGRDLAPAGVKPSGIRAETSAPSRGGFSGIGAPDTYAGKPQGWGDYLTSREFVVPLLSGLGKMAGSNSRYLGSAVLQGIGGAAESYQNLENQLSERDIKRGELNVKQQESGVKLMDYYKGNFTRFWDPETKQFKYRNQLNPSKTYTENEYSSLMGDLANRVLSGQSGQQISQRAAAPSTISQPPAGGAGTEPAKVAEGPKVGEEQVKPAPGPTTQLHATFEDTDNPDWLKKEARSLTDQANAFVRQGIASKEDQTVKESFAQAERYIARAKEIESGSILPQKKDGSGQDPTYYNATKDRELKASDAAKRMEGVNTSVNKFRGEVEGVQRDRAKVDAVVSTLDTAYALSGQKLGPGSKDLADLYTKLAYISNFVPGMEKFMQKYSNKDAFMSTFASGEKGALTEAVSAIRDMDAQRAPASMLKITPRIVADPNLPAASRYEIMANSRTEIEMERKLHKDWLAAKQPDPVAFTAEWQARPENDISRVKNNVKKSMHLYDGMTPEEIRIWGPKNYKYDTKSGHKLDQDTGIIYDENDKEVGRQARGQ